MYIFIHVKKIASNCYVRWGRGVVKNLASASAKNASFFTCSRPMLVHCLLFSLRNKRQPRFLCATVFSSSDLLSGPTPSLLIWEKNNLQMNIRTKRHIHID